MNHRVKKFFRKITSAMVETYIIRYLLYALHPSLLQFGKRPIELNRIDAISVHIKNIFENDLKQKKQNMMF